MAEAGPAVFPSAGPSEPDGVSGRDAERLLGSIDRLGRRLWRQRLAVNAARAVLLAVAALSLSSSLVPPAQRPVVAGAGAALALGLLALAWARRPGPREVALLADRRLGLQARATTALELVEAGAGGDLARRQVLDAGRRLAAADPCLALPFRLAPAERLRLGALALVAAAALVGRAVPAAPLTGPRPAEPGLSAAAAPDQADRSGEPGASRRPEERAEPDTGGRRARAAEPTAPLGRWAPREEAALERLARALDELAATRGAASALRQGDLPAAAAELASLAGELPRFSPRGRGELGRALAGAAADLDATTPGLARRLAAAATALAGDETQAADAALRELAAALAAVGEEGAGEAAALAEADLAGVERPAGQGEARDGAGPLDGAGAGRGASPLAGSATERLPAPAGAAGTGQRVVDPLSGPATPLELRSARALGIAGSAGSAALRVVGLESGLPTGPSGAASFPVGGGWSGGPAADGPSPFVAPEHRALVRSYFSWPREASAGSDGGRGPSQEDQSRELGKGELGKGELGKGEQAKGMGEVSSR